MYAGMLFKYYKSSIRQWYNHDKTIIQSPHFVNFNKLKKKKRNINRIIEVRKEGEEEEKES